MWKLFVISLICLGRAERAASFSTSRFPLAKRPQFPRHSSSLCAVSTKPLDYNWKDHWYAVTFSSYVPNPSDSAEVVPAAVFGQPLALWRSDDNGPVHCVNDACPHRAAALTEGRIRDGRIECLYHGWQFNEEGSCTRIPQLEPGAEIPKRSCLQTRPVRTVEDIVWVWMGDEEPDRNPPESGDDISEDKPDYWVNSFQIDLPYDHSYLVENLIDPAHIPISHDRTSGGGMRENAQAYEMQVDSESVTSSGFTGRYRNAAEPDSAWNEVAFEAPGIVRYKSKTESGLKFGGALHCMPLAMGRSRLLFRTYATGLPWIFKLIVKLRPRFLFHLNSCKVLEQDVGLITTQEDHIRRKGSTGLKNDFLLLQSSDAFVRAYRQWLDRVGAGMPWFQGLVSSSEAMSSSSGEGLPPGLLPKHRASNQDSFETRYHRHVIHCPTTRNALQRVKSWKVRSVALAFGGLAASIVLPSRKTLIKSLCVVSSVVFGLLASGLNSLEQRFYYSFRRKDQLRGERGI